ncbi:reverse transcriptase domain-containing protein, partial [Tanacetum coccineum]
MTPNLIFPLTHQLLRSYGGDSGPDMSFDKGDYTSSDTLKKCTNKKDFRWIEAAEVVFLEMKKLVSDLLTLTTPKKGETLMMYLAVASEAVSARLYTDGASNNGGSRAGLILVALDDVEYSYALRLNFSNSNNDVEYEALLAGLWIATEMQVKDIHAFVDSKLVASRVEGSYEAKGERMIKYQEKVLE